MSAKSSARAVMDFLDDPKRGIPLAIGGGVLKGAVVGLVVGQLGVAMALGLGGGAIAAGVLVVRSSRRARDGKAPRGTP